MSVALVAKKRKQSLELSMVELAVSDGQIPFKSCLRYTVDLHTTATTDNRNLVFLN